MFDTFLDITILNKGDIHQIHTIKRSIVSFIGLYSICHFSIQPYSLLFHVFSKFKNYRNVSNYLIVLNKLNLLTEVFKSNPSLYCVFRQFLIDDI